MSEDVRRIVAEFTARDKSKGAMLSFNRGLKSLSGTMLRMAGLGGGIYALQRGLRDITTAAMEQEKVENELEAALGHSIDTYKDYARQIQKTTIYGDEQILTQMAYAKNLGVTEEKLKAATTAAVGLAAKYRLDLASSMMLVGRASQGQTQMLTRYGIVLDETLSTSEKFDALLKIGADSMHLARAETETAAGAFKQWENASGDLQEALGNKLLPILTEVAKAATEVAQTDWSDLANTLIEGPNVVFRKPEYTAEMKKAAQDMYREMTGEANAWHTEMQRIGHDVYDVPVRPKNLELYNQLLREQLELTKERKRTAAAMNVGTLPAAEGGLESARAQLDEVNKVLDARAKSYVKMYDDIGIYDERYMNMQNRLLDQQVEKYRETVADETLLAQWKQSKLAKIEEKITKKHNEENEKRKNAIEMWVESYSGDNVWDRLSEDYARGLDSLATTMTDFMINGKADWDAWGVSLLTSFVDTLNKMAAAQLQTDLIKPLISGIASGIGGLFGGGGMITAGGSAAGGGNPYFLHGGGIVGTDGVRKPVPFGTFANAPRLHLGSNEVPIIAEKGEKIIPKNQAGSVEAGTNVKIIMVYDDRQAAIEAMNSAEGEKVIIRHVARNRRILG